MTAHETSARVYPFRDQIAFDTSSLPGTLYLSRSLALSLAHALEKAALGEAKHGPPVTVDGTEDPTLHDPQGFKDWAQMELDKAEKKWQEFNMPEGTLFPYLDPSGVLNLLAALCGDDTREEAQ